MLHDIIAWTYNVFGCVVEQRIGEMIMANNTNIAYTCTWHLRCVCYNQITTYHIRTCTVIILVFFIYKKNNTATTAIHTV